MELWVIFMDLILKTLLDALNSIRSKPKLIPVLIPVPDKKGDRRG
jgi:hypothetical protein